jgi:cysteinyl-tRNA synthetase
MPERSPDGSTMQLRLVDSLSGRRKVVPPPRGRTVGMYVCGPTVYDAAHVGHARTYLFFDVLRRVLESEGYRVRHVMNVTDLEDKIDVRAASLGISSKALARAEERAFFRDLAAFGNLPPTFRPRASEFVPEIIRVARALERTGRVHRHDGEWRYEAPERRPGENFLTTADLARHAVPEPGHAFGAPSDGERSFVVWKQLSPPLPSWPSRWGRGAPGWHLQCFAMASHLVGVPVDLHGGGRDLVYPHHFAENEISLALRGAPFSPVFVHTGLVLQSGSKMSKSTGNLVPLRTALAAVGPAALRWHLLSRPYRDRFSWEDSGCRAAWEELDLLRSTVRSWMRSTRGGRVGAARAARLARTVRSALLNGLATETVVAELRQFAAEVAASPGGVTRGDRRAVKSSLREVERRIGIPLA